jgi:hypothetical protein
MSKKNLTRGKHAEGGSPGQNRPVEGEEIRQRAGHPGAIKLGFVLVGTILGVALLWGSILRNRDGSESERISDGRTLSGEASKAEVSSPVASPTAKPAVTALPPAPPGTKAPVNDVDPVTGRPITPTSPSKVYKGYVIAFCCAQSAGYTGNWDRMSETEKDAFVSRYVAGGPRPGAETSPVSAPMASPVPIEKPPASADTLPATALTTAQVPINNVDPITGKPILPDSPRTLYKGYVIAFCCSQSPSANGGWERMSEVDKDAFVARFTMSGVSTEPDTGSTTTPNGGTGSRE